MKTSYAISWIYGEFKIARMQKNLPYQTWAADYKVESLESLCRAMSEAGQHIDLSHGGDLAIAYEDDKHTHDFFAVPEMDKKDLEKLLQRKVLQNKPFEEEAAWCYHEAKHETEDEGILLHLLPQNIVNSTIRICQEFYLTPNRLVPLTEVISEATVTYKQPETDILIVVALFQERTEIVITLGNGEILFVRELTYSSYDDGIDRLVTDINRTIRYSKQRFGVVVSSTWLLGEQSDEIHTRIDADIESKLYYDPNSLEPFFWATEVSNLTGQGSANFIPLLARKRINRTLFYRIALWLVSITVASSIGIGMTVEYAIAKQSINKQTLHLDINSINQEIHRIEGLLEQSTKDKQELLLLHADAKNLPALFVSYLGDITPKGLIITQAKIEKMNAEWFVSIKGISDLNLSEIAPVLTELETGLTDNPWNITINKSWRNSWYQQLKQGAAASQSELGFEITGWMK